MGTDLRRLSRLLLGSVALWLAATAAAEADELLPPDRELAVVIDHYIDARLQAAGITPAPLADDAGLLRRTMLDLAGRIPTAAEAQAYVAETDPRKREQLVDRMLASPGYERHQVNELGVLLGSGGKSNLREYLERAVAENRRWDQIFRELMLPEQSDESGKGAAQFLKSRISDLDRLANETSVVFFGVNVSCAKCHDHPLVSSWTQDHFYGMASFFSRTFDHGDFLGERNYGLMKYETTSGQSRMAQLMFLTGTVIDEPAGDEPPEDQKKREKDLLEQLRKDKKPAPPPAFSRRAKLVEIALEPQERHYFAKAIVNQLWHRFYGYGLVMPLDQMHPENPPSHPELMEWLARDLVEHNYDLKRLIRGLVLSQAYARSSRWEEGDRPAPWHFAVANVRPLTPAQYAAVLGLGSASPGQFPADLKPEDLEGRLRSAEGQGRGVVEKLEQPREEFQVSVDEALLMSNSERMMREVLRDSKQSLLDYVKSEPDRNAAIRAAVWNTLSRPADDEEVQVLASYLASREDRLVAAWQQLLWALLTSTEARFNH